MTRQHDLDDMFLASFDDSVEHDLRQLFAAVQAPADSDELAAEASVVAAMSDAVHRQSALHHVTRRRTPWHRAVASRTAKVAMITGFAVVSTSAAAVAGVLPQPMQSALDRVAGIASWQTSDREGPAAVSDEPEPTTITKIVEVPDAIARSTIPLFVAVDRETDPQALCGTRATSIRSGVELEADARRALAAIASRAGVAVERLCEPFAPAAHEASPTAQASASPEALLPPPISTVDTIPVPTPDAPAASTNDGTPKATPTLPPPADGNGGPAREPSPAEEGNDTSSDGTPDPNANANANAHANANSHGGNPNANPNAGGANVNANANANANGNRNDAGANATGSGRSNDAGANGNANGGSVNSNRRNDDGNG